MTTAPAPGSEKTELTFVDGLDSLLPVQPGPTTPTPADRKTGRLHARRAENRADRTHDLNLKATSRRLRREEAQARRDERREDRAKARATRKAARIERRAEHADRNDRVRRQALAAVRHLMVIGPITAPMAVAWSSQTSYAMTAFGWNLLFALGFAAAWELSTAFTGWMYHQARQAGDRGLEYRLLTWVFALGAAAMNYAHHAGPGGAPTQASVAFSAMSVSGMVLWESYARLVHRRLLRAKGMLPTARPRLGAARWLRYPVHSWTAWSLTILSADHRTAEDAWTAADRILSDRRTARSIRSADRSAVRSGLAVHRVVVARVRTADRGPSSVPAFVALDRVDRTGQDRQASVPVDRTDRAALGPGHGPADRTESVDRTAPVDRRSTVDRPAHNNGPRVDRTATAQQRTDGPRVDRTGPDRPAAPAKRTAPVDRTGPDDLDLTDIEQQAVDHLRSTGRSISKRSIAETVRTELGQSIASDRAAEIARYHRTLKSA